MKKGDWVLIHKIVLKPEERSPLIPDDTKKVPLEMWVKGFLQSDANLGDTVKVKTKIGRLEEGTLVALNPTYKHNYGDFVPQILQIDEIVKEVMERGNKNG